jgi:outer membrane protein assembly factor BamB
MTHSLALARRQALGLLCLCLALAAPAAGTQRRPRRPAPPKPEPQKPDAQTPEARQVSSSILVRWSGTPGVNRYRLQLATDEQFQDVVYDQPVEGRQHIVRGLPSGNYFWRVAPAAAETSTFFSRPERVAVSGKAATVSDNSNAFVPDESAGWRTATGEVARLVPARIRVGAVIDFVGVAHDGRVFALDGVNGTLLWNARYNPAGGAKSAPGQTFPPLVAEFGLGLNDVIVAYDGGVRSLRGDTGQEDWRAPLEGRAVSGAVASLDADPDPEVVVVTANPHRLYVLSHSTGALKLQKGLDAEVIGAPHVFDSGGARAVALALRNGELELRGADGQVLQETKLEGELTTAPLVVARGELRVLVVGTDRGLAALSVPDLKLLGRIVADDDAVRGVLNSADINGDGAAEIVMVTRKGRVALVSTTDGNVMWHAEGATDASGATFADLDGDNVLDVIVPGGAAFALGFSGRDGSLLMRVEEGGRPVEVKAGVAPRALVIAPTPSGQGMLVGSDPARVGLRAVGLPRGGGRTASN